MEAVTDLRMRVAIRYPARMTKRRWSVASVGALAAAMVVVIGAGCSSTTASPTDAGTRVTPDVQNDVAVESAVDAGAKGCPSADVIDATKLPWKPPTPPQAVCTEKELTQLVAFVDKSSDPQSWQSGDWTTNAACRACVFAKETATWAPLVIDESGRVDSINVGGCVAIASGKEACGKAYHQWRSCYLEACGGCPEGDSARFSTCVNAANKGACKKAFDDVVPACGDIETANDAETTCEGKYTFEGPVRAQCIGLVVRDN